jgi:LysM repeat protein
MKAFVLLLLLGFWGCSPLRTSPHDERYRWELTLHEVQTNLDDLRHDTNCVQTEIQILEGRIKSFEHAIASLKQQEIEKLQARLDQFSQQFHLLDKKWTAFEKKQDTGKDGIESLSIHANEMNMALSQFKERIGELEKEIIRQNRQLESFGKIKGNLESLTKSLKAESPRIHKVRLGDSLEKIAKVYKTDAAAIKQLNQLSSDLIIVDQELKIP